MCPSAAVHYYVANRIGNVIAMVDAAGAVTDRYVYTPYGVEEPLSSSANPFRYTGRRYDPQTGLYHYRARYYDAEWGRFLETDPVLYADQMNLYTYVGNDPLGAIDPTGEWRMLAQMARGAVYGAVSGFVGASISSEGNPRAIAAGTIAGAGAGAVTLNPIAASLAGSVAGQLGAQALENYDADRPLSSNLSIDTGAAAGATLGATAVGPLVSAVRKWVAPLRPNIIGRERGAATINRTPGELASSLAEGSAVGASELAGSYASNIVERAGIPATLQITDESGDLNIEMRCKTPELC